MARRGGSVHVVTTTRRYKGRVYTTHLLRRSYREDGKVKNETVGNLSHLPDAVIELVRRALRGEQVLPVAERFEVLRSQHHGHVHAVLTAMRRLGFETLVAARHSRERDLVVALVAARILGPRSKLATHRWWGLTTLPESLGVEDATEDDLYAAMDWLLSRQRAIEKKLATRHLAEGGFALCDLTSSYFEGRCCPLAARGHNRDGKRDKLQVNYALLTDRQGRPVSVSVFQGNTNDPKTLLPQVQKLREAFGIRNVAVVGDRGMISQTQIDALRQLSGMDWITALRSAAIQKLLQGGHLQLGLFDERNLFELRHPDYPGERLVACRNPELAKLRAHKRQSLLDATARELEKVRGMVAHGRLKGQDAIGVRVGKVVNKYKVAKHFHLEIRDRAFDYHVQQAQVDAEAALDGIYVVRTSLPRKRLDAADTVRTYKSLSDVERAFRSFKSVDLKVRPIYHWTEDRVRAHIFLCLLAYYVEWHMIEAWRPLLFCDEDQSAKKTRDPVAPATRSEGAFRKVHSKHMDDGSVVHSFQTLLQGLSSIVRNRCRTPRAGENAPTFTLDTQRTPQQQRAYDLLERIAM
jgi:transposase